MLDNRSTMTVCGLLREGEPVTKDDTIAKSEAGLLDVSVPGSVAGLVGGGLRGRPTLCAGRTVAVTTCKVSFTGDLRFRGRPIFRTTGVTSAEFDR